MGRLGCPSALRRFACARFRVLVTLLRTTVTTLYVCYTGGEKISWQDGIPREGPSHAAAVRRRSSPIGNPHGHSPWLCGNPTAASGLEGVEE